jgi:hypothetical protein
MHDASNARSKIEGIRGIEGIRELERLREFEGNTNFV